MLAKQQDQADGPERRSREEAHIHPGVREEGRASDLERVARQLTEEPSDRPAQEAEPRQAVVALGPADRAGRADDRAERGTGPREVGECAARIGIWYELLGHIHEDRAEQGGEVRARRPAREHSTDPSGDHA